jgi:MFS family permease
LRPDHQARNEFGELISLILTKPPYNFKTSQVGLCYLSGCLGVFLGDLAFGFISDRLALKLARRNNGVMEPEHRLWPLCATMILVPASLILWGVGAAHRKSQ